MGLKSFFERIFPASAKTYHARTDHMEAVISEIVEQQQKLIDCVECLDHRNRSEFLFIHSQFEQISEWESETVSGICDIAAFQKGIREDFEKLAGEIQKMLLAQNAFSGALDKLTGETQQLMSGQEAAHDLLGMLTDETKKVLLAQNAFSGALDKLTAETQKLMSGQEAIRNFVEELVSEMKRASSVHDIVSESADRFSAGIDKILALQKVMNDSANLLKCKIDELAEEQRDDSVLLQQKSAETIQAVTEQVNDLCGAMNSSRDAILLACDKRTSKFSNTSIFKQVWDLAGKQTAEYVIKHLPKCITYPNAVVLREKALGHVSIEGMYLEFGVFSGKTINQISELKPDEVVYGFDSFKGLPETWRTGFYTSKFATDVLPEVNQNVELVVGWFDETLPDFVKKHSENCAFLHVDCDLYSSAKTIFAFLKDRIVPGTVIVFDEYFNYPSWQDNEFKAFQEFVEENGVEYEYIGYVPNHEQAAVKIQTVNLSK